MLPPQPKWQHYRERWPAHWQSVFPPFFFHPAHALISAGGDDDEEEKERPKEGWNVCLSSASTATDEVPIKVARICLEPAEPQFKSNLSTLWGRVVKIRAGRETTAIPTLFSTISLSCSFPRFLCFAGENEKFLLIKHPLVRETERGIRKLSKEEKNGRCYDVSDL